jgi:hypothetical protein
MKSILTGDGVVSCSPWIWSFVSNSDPWVVSICSFTWGEVWSGGIFDTTSSTVSLTVVDEVVIVSEGRSVTIEVMFSSLFWSILGVAIWIDRWNHLRKENREQPTSFSADGISSDVEGEITLWIFSVTVAIGCVIASRSDSKIVFDSVDTTESDFSSVILAF